MNSESQSQIEAIIFDLFGVLLAFDDDIVYQRIALHCGDPELAFEQLEGLTSGLQVMTGRQSLLQTHSILRETLGLKLDYPAFVEAWNEPYSTPMPGMVELVEELRGRCKLLLLSNVDSDYWQAIRPRHPELDRFDALILSCNVGLAKPDPAIYAYASRVAGVEPAKCLFIDDTRRNVDGALKAGLQAVQFSGVDALREELWSRGVSFVPRVE